MKQRSFLFSIAMALPILASLTMSCAAQDIRPGQTMKVKPNSIWFQDQAQLDRWQQLRTSGDDAALQSYQHELLSSRDAWQFINEMTVRVIKYNAAKHQADVKMTTPGRMLGSTWIVEADAIQTPSQ